MITGLDINLRGKDGNTALHCAVIKNSLPIVKYLLEECPYKNAININLKNNLNKSCADLASGAVKTYLTPLITMSVKEIEYDNPILNHPEIIKNAVEKCGGSIISKLIDLGKQFADNEEHKELLETVCQNDNSLENILALIGLDLQQESI